MTYIMNASASLALSQQLNKIGNGDANKLLSMDISNFMQILDLDQQTRVCVTGGIGDGTASIPKDDIDAMFIDDFIIITEAGDDIVPNEDKLLVTMERKSDRPGFVLLKLLPCYIEFMRQDLSFKDLEDTLVEIPGEGFYLHAKGVLESTLPTIYPTHRSGPALTSSMRLDKNSILTQHMDCVWSIFYPKWPDEAKSWPGRVHNCSWPPVEMVIAIVSSGCHLVPKGSQGGEFCDYEWCISFAMHEKCLIRSFNSVQYHHYMLLKWILKHKFRAQYPNIMTSYVAKTVCLWQMELTKREMWQMKLLIDRIVQSMLFLRDCISNRYVSHYFIPENNIVHGKLTFQTRDELVKDLSGFVGVFIDLCKKPKDLSQFIFGNNELDMDIPMRLSVYYNFVSPTLTTSGDPNIHTSVENMFQSVEKIHGSVIKTIDILKKHALFNVAHETLLRCIGESELHVEDYQSSLELILLQQLSNDCGFSTKVCIAEIYYMLRQPDKSIAIITEALTMDTAVALKGKNDIRNRGREELLGIIKARPLMSLSQFIRTYVIPPIQLSEEHIYLWSRILQQDIFQTIRSRPIDVDAHVYACFLLALAFHFSARPEMSAETVNTLICLIAEEPSNLDYKDVAMCLLDYVVKLTSRNSTVVN